MRHIVISLMSLYDMVGQRRCGMRRIEFYQCGRAIEIQDARLGITITIQEM